MTQFQNDALMWLTHVRGADRTFAAGVSRQERQDLFFGGPDSSTNRWLSSAARADFAPPPVDDGERDAESLELVGERNRRRALPLKNLLLRSAPPAPAPSAAPPSMAIGFDAIDTRAFALSVANMGAKAAAAAAGVRRSSFSGSKGARPTQQQQQQQPLDSYATSAAAHQRNLGQAQQALQTVQEQSDLSAASTRRAAESSGGISLGEDGSCTALGGLRTVAAIDYLVKRLTVQRLDIVVTSIHVSQSSAVQTYHEQEGPLVHRIVPLTFLRDELPWLRCTVLIAENCALHDYDADFIARALREPSCLLERVSLRNNLITEDGVDRLKKAVKHNVRIQSIELAGNPATQKPSEKGRGILALLDERLAANRRKKFK